MTTQTEALKLALEALETDWGTVKAIAAIKEALAQPAVPQPSRSDMGHEHSAPHGEPVAFLVYDPRVQSQELYFDDDLGDTDCCEITPLYTTSPQRKEPEQEPVALNKKIKTLIEEGDSQVSIAMQLGGAVGSSSYNKMYQNLEKYFEEKDEPVAWGFENTAITGGNRWMMLREEIPANDQYGGDLWTPLYTTPPQRTWVGLTDEEKQEWIDAMPYDPQPRHCTILVNIIEAKLKEKNT